MSDETKLDGDLRVFWRKTIDGLPKKPGKKNYEQIECLIMLPSGEIEISLWNCEHEVWDDEHGDDYRHDPCKPTHWMPLAPIRAALGDAQPAPADDVEEYEVAAYQVQYWAEIGAADGFGIGRMESVQRSQVFPRKADAEAWLDAQGWLFDERLMRRTNPDDGGAYGMAHVRRVQQGDKSKWITPALRNTGGAA